MLRSPLQPLLRPLLRLPTDAAVGGSANTSGLILIAAGQSNATRRTPKVTTTYPATLYTFSGGNETVDRSDGLSITTPMPGSTFASKLAFSEFGVNSESLAPGYASVASRYGEIITHTPARAGFYYRDMMNGQGSWSDLTTAIRRGAEILRADGFTNIDVVIIWDHGEADASDGPTTTEYVEVLQDLVTNAIRSARLALGRPTYVPLIIGAQPMVTAGAGYRAMQNAHLVAAQTVTNYYLAGPRYVYPDEGDATHITGLGHRLFAEYIAARVADIAAGNPLPTYITSASRSGAVITANYHTISGNLVIDTTAVTQTTTDVPASKNGFEWYTGGVTAVNVSNVAVNGTTATITLASDPGASGELRYAQLAFPKKARGNIRDSGTRTALHDGSTLYNWAVHQTVAVS